MDDDTGSRPDDKANGLSQDSQSAGEHDEPDAEAEPETEETPWWIADPCPSWCNSEHEADEHDEDRAHFSDAIKVPVIRAGSPPYLDGDDAAESAEYYIVMRQYLGQHETWVYIGDGERKGLEITAESAARLGWALRRLPIGAAS